MLHYLRYIIVLDLIGTINCQPSWDPKGLAASSSLSIQLKVSQKTPQFRKQRYIPHQVLSLPSLYFEARVKLHIICKKCYIRLGSQRLRNAVINAKKESVCPSHSRHSHRPWFIECSAIQKTTRTLHSEFTAKTHKDDKKHVLVILNREKRK